MGGTACLRPRSGSRPSLRCGWQGGSCSAPVEFEGLSAEQAVPDIVVPMLFVAAENDWEQKAHDSLESLSATSANC